MAKSEMGTLLTFGLVGAGIYFAWPYISQLLGSISAAPLAPTVPPVPLPPTQMGPCNMIPSADGQTAILNGASMPIAQAIAQCNLPQNRVPVSNPSCYTLLPMTPGMAMMNGQVVPLGIAIAQCAGMGRYGRRF